MQNDKETLKKLHWCAKARNGIAIVEPSENLAKAYLGKAQNALKSMDINAKSEIIDWFVSTSYYAKYFAVYALFSKIGIKCEIHDCTIALFEYLFKGEVPQELIEEIKVSKNDRIEAQYYTDKVYVDIEGVAFQAKNFVLEMERIIEGTTNDKIRHLRTEVSKLLT